MSHTSITDTTNTQLAELATRGPWHFFHSAPDMAAVVEAFAGAAHVAIQEGNAADVLGTKKEEQPTLSRECKSLIDVLRQQSPEEENPAGEIKHHLLGVAAKGDLFELRWYSLFVLYTSSQFRTHMCRGAPKQVCDRILNRFVDYLDLHLFGTPPSKTKTKSKKLQQSILTPTELVPRFLSDLRMAYFASNEDSM